MILRDAKAIKLGSNTINKIYSGSYKVYDTNKTVLEGYCVQNGEPTPDNPIEIQTMKGRQIIPIQKINIISTDVNDWEGGQYDANTGAKVNSGSRIRMKELVPVEPGNVYYINTFLDGYNLILRTYNENKAFISSIGNVTNGTTITVTTAKYISVSLWKNGDSSIGYTTLLQKISNKEMTPYICIDSQKYVVDLKSKNLYDKNNVDYNNSYIIADGTIRQHNNWRISDYIRVNSNQNYTYQGLSAVGNAPYSAYYDENKTFISSFKQAIGTNTITIPNGATYVRFSVNKASGGDLDTFQLEQGSTATTYEPYYDYELAGINEYKDSIYTKEGKWYKHNEILKYILNGTENWSIGASGTDNWYYKIDTGKIVKATNGLSTHYRRVNNITTSNTNKGYSFQYATATNYQVRIRYGTEDTVANYKTWLSNNNVTIYQVFGDDYTTEEQITAPGLIAQLNRVYQAM